MLPTDCHCCIPYLNMSTPSSGNTMPRRSANSRRRGGQRQRHANAAAGAEDDTEEVRTLRATYPTQLAMLSELFPTWTDEDLLFVILESNGEVEIAVGRISEGHAEQFSSCLLYTSPSPRD